MKTAHLYARVSSADQDTAAQLLRLHVAAKSYPDHQPRVWEDTASGGTPWRARSLANILEAAIADDVLIVPEVSRIGRSTADVLDFIAQCAKRKIALRVDKSNLTIGQDMQSKIITTIMALAAEIERDFLRSRTREGMAAARAAGKQIGRPTGPAINHSMDIHQEIIADLVAKQLPKASICKLLPCTIRQLNTHLARVKRGIMPRQKAAAAHT